MWNWHLQDTLCEVQSRQGGVTIVLLDLLLQTRELDFKKHLKFCLIIDGFMMTVPRLVAL